MRSVIALYQDRQISRSAIDDLVEHGFEKERINVVSDGAGRDTRTGETENQLMRDLDARNVPHDNAELYVAGVRRGYSLIVVETSDERADEASTILDRHTPVDLEAAVEPESTTRAEGETGHIDVIEEEVKVGKRPVQTGGVRVHSYVTERPVEEDVTLREERVHVERHPVDEPLSADAAQRAFKEETIELETHGEEAVVGREARIVERVDISKDVGTRTEHVQDVERRQDVEVETLGNEEELRRDWEANYEAKGIDFDTYRHAYGVGHRSGGEERHRSAEWSAAEPELRREWDERHKDRGPWEKFKSTVRSGWDKARGK